MARAFRYAPQTKGNGIAAWKVRGEVPRGHQLGLFLGLLHARGRDKVIAQLGKDVSPKLFGVDRWSDLAGWPSMLPKQKTRKRKLRKG